MMAETAGSQPSTDPPVALFKKRGAKNNVRKRPATPPQDSDSEYSSEDDNGRKIKRRRKGGVALGSSTNQSHTTAADLKATEFSANKSSNIASVNDATKASNWYDESAQDAPSAQNLLGNRSKHRPTPDTQQIADGAYKGASSYQSFIEKNPNAPDWKVGPMKAPANVRTITVTDFAPDVCKDYKQTGFCGFGDSCKFLHAREDYKQGWELDRDWEIGTKGKKLEGKTVARADRNANVGGESDEEEDKLLENIPFACVICKQSYKNPIITKCGHYFCEKCALDRYRKTPNCAACGQGTGGVFNGAKGLKKILDRKKERARKRKDKAREEGEEVSSDEEEDND